MSARRNDLLAAFPANIGHSMLDLERNGTMANYNNYVHKVNLKERNAKIVESVEAMVPISSIARQHQLSPARVYQIWLENRNERKIELTSRVQNVLMRIGCLHDTKTEIRNAVIEYGIKNLQNARGLGPGGFWQLVEFLGLRDYVQETFVDQAELTKAQKNISDKIKYHEKRIAVHKVWLKHYKRLEKNNAGV